MSLKVKFISSILTVSFLLVATILYFVLTSTYKQIKHETYQSIENQNKEIAIWTQNVLDKGMFTAREYSSMLLTMKQTKNPNRDIAVELCKKFTEDNDDYYSVWATFEPNGFDGKDSNFVNAGGCNTEKGRLSAGYYRDGASVVLSEALLDIEADTSDYYTLPKEKKEEIILEPYMYSYTENAADAILETNLIVPIMENNTFIGAAGVDISLKTLDDKISKIKIFETGFCKLVSNKGLIVSAKDTAIVRKESKEFLGEKSKQIIDSIQNGKAFSSESFSSDLNCDAFMTFAPIVVGKTTTPWSIAIKVPVKEVLAEANNSFYKMFLLAIVGLLTLGFIMFRLISSMVNPIAKITTVLEDISLGKVSENSKLHFNNQDEIGKIGNAVNQLIDGLNSTSTFAKEIGTGNLAAKFEPLSSEDVLGNALLDMRKNLENARDEEDRRKQEDEQRNWATSGHARFAEILRQNNDNIEKLSFNLIKNLVDYCCSNQGGVFILNENDKDNSFLELTACYAFNRQKYLQKNIIIGEGLVGTCYLEGKTIFLTEVPQKYINITSGLGESNPKCILIVPLKLNDVIYGIIEIASFKVLRPFEVEFVEKLGESIASTISSVKVNIKTAQLLEISQQQSEEMRAQEEEMRQNMEEMHATQEELQRKDAMTNEMVQQMKVQEEELKVNLAQMSEKEKYTQDLIETMKQQEEEMRQNMEEMHATQEELQRKDILTSEMVERMKVQEEELKVNLAEMSEKEKYTQGLIATMKIQEEEMKVKQAEVIENEEKVLGILNSSPDAIVSIKPDGSINELNEPMVLLSTYSREELKQMNINQIFKFLKLDKIKAGLKKREKALLRDGNSVMTEIIFGEFNNKGIKEWLFFIKDITVDIQKEQELVVQMEKAMLIKAEMKEKEILLEKQVEEQMINLAKLSAAQRTIDDNCKVAAMKEKKLKAEIETLKQTIQDLGNKK